MMSYHSNFASHHYTCDRHVVVFFLSSFFEWPGTGMHNKMFRNQINLKGHWTSITSIFLCLIP